jgi:hypothetical protein
MRFFNMFCHANTLSLKAAQNKPLETDSRSLKRVRFAKIRALIWRNIMKPLQSVAIAAILAAASVGAYAQSAPATDAPPAHVMSPEENAGLPDLKAINRPAAQVTSKVEISPPRLPSYHEESTNGTEITEYRDKGKPVEINVRSNFGTRYQMSAPADTSPSVRDNGKPSTRLPSWNLHY